MSDSHSKNTYTALSIALFLSFCLLHMLKMFSDSYCSIHRAVLPSLIKQFITVYCSLVLSFSQIQNNSKQPPFLIFYPFFSLETFSFFSFLYPVSTCPFLVFLLFSIVLHLSLFVCISHFTFSGSINYYHDCVSMCVLQV